MKNYYEVKGDLIKLAYEFDVVAHGCNCYSAMHNGIAPQMVKEFMCDKYKSESLQEIGNINKLGTVECNRLHPNPLIDKKYPMVVNAYTQYYPGPYVNYAAIELCFYKMNNLFIGKTIGIPQIGCGIAGGDWEIVKKLIHERLTNVKVVVVMYDELYNIYDPINKKDYKKFIKFLTS